MFQQRGLRLPCGALVCLLFQHLLPSTKLTLHTGLQRRQRSALRFPVLRSFVHLFGMPAEPKAQRQQQRGDADIAHQLLDHGSAPLDGQHQRNHLVLAQVRKVRALSHQLPLGFLFRFHQRAGKNLTRTHVFQTEAHAWLLVGLQSQPTPASFMARSITSGAYGCSAFSCHTIAITIPRRSTASSVISASGSSPTRCATSST